MCWRKSWARDSKFEILTPLAQCNHVSVAASLCFSILTTIFPREHRLVGFIEAKDDGSCGDDWSCKSCKAAITS